ncbi:hypothetical protein EOS_31330 [Caballeronia mineralivorans PML1(12)]|uniref:Uncharacterized protein n=1 Tax=Caballeronia mineralivorans PML1(12) TaxID=908627 RepID=A0A0J1CNM2_9BURK|nr:hypothetical protein [Caballeronia mineralivorans]KLU22292.1 hypothetical protein EOS_31330 [Caballeronia mineralivorans PML1(12)]
MKDGGVYYRDGANSEMTGPAHIGICEKLHIISMTFSPICMSKKTQKEDKAIHYNMPLALDVLSVADSPDTGMVATIETLRRLSS